MAKLSGRNQDCPARSSRWNRDGQQVPDDGVSATPVDALQMCNKVGSTRSDIVVKIQHALISFLCGPQS